MKNTDQVIEYCKDHSTPESSFFQKVVKTTHDSTEHPKMISGPNVGSFLQTLIRFGKAEKILEIGTFTGYASMKMAEATSANGIVETCEYDKKHAEIAQAFFDESGFSEKIRLHTGPAIETIITFPDGHFDFIFVDADKISYPKYYEIGLQKLRLGGLIVLDNMLWSGTVVNPRDEDTHALRLTGDTIQQDDRVWNQLFNIRDGLMVCIKHKD